MPDNSYLTGTKRRREGPAVHMWALGVVKGVPGAVVAFHQKPSQFALEKSDVNSWGTIKPAIFDGETEHPQ